MWLQHSDITDKDVLLAMESVPRHEFVPQEYVNQAYEDHPLPIGYGQTISQPYIVALMTQLLELKRSDRVLEIGTGSGYQTAILAQLVDEVYSVEIVSKLAEEARARLARLGYTHVKIKCADGFYGWAEHAPYDAIIVTAAPAEIPAPLLAQLAEGGRMVIPIGDDRSHQQLQKLKKQAGKIITENVIGVVFVPFTRREENGGETSQ